MMLDVVFAHRSCHKRSIRSSLMMMHHTVIGMRRGWETRTQQRRGIWTKIPRDSSQWRPRGFSRTTKSRFHQFLFCHSKTWSIQISRTSNQHETLGSLCVLEDVNLSGQTFSLVIGKRRWRRYQVPTFHTSCSTLILFGRGVFVW